VKWRVGVSHLWKRDGPRRHTALRAARNIGVHTLLTLNGTVHAVTFWQSGGQQPEALRTHTVDRTLLP
jgi:hypothetical protein